MAFKTQAEKNAFKGGLFAGLFGKKKNRKKNNKNKAQTTKEKNVNTLKDLHRRYRERNLGALSYNGKIYDTNFKDGPHEITKEDIRELRKEYDIYGKMSDIEVADQYVRHMRKKFGTFDKKTGKWLGLLGDE